MTRLRNWVVAFLADRIFLSESRAQAIDQEYSNIKPRNRGIRLSRERGLKKVTQWLPDRLFPHTIEMSRFDLPAFFS